MNLLLRPCTWVIFENFVISMTSCLLKLKVTPSFCFAFKIPDDPTATVSSKAQKMGWQQQIIPKFNRPGCAYKLTRLLNCWQNCWDLFKLLLCLGHFFRGIFRLGLGLIGFFQSTQSRYFIIGCNVSFSRQTSFSLLQLVCEWGGGWGQFRCWFLTFDCLFFDDASFFGGFFGNFLTLKK